jgi:hypothetical protein
MMRHPCDVRWAKPAIEAFKKKYGPDDADAVNAILINVRDHPDNLQLRKLVDKKELLPEIERVEGDVYVSRDGSWDVYYNWSRDHIFVVHAEKSSFAKKD